MLFIRVILFVFTLTVTLSAQTIEEITSTPACILNCAVNAAAEVGCPLDINNANCVCGSAQFQNSTSTCLQKYCTTDEIKKAAELQATKCAGAVVKSTDASTTASSSGTVGAATSTSQATFRNAAQMITHSSVVSVFAVIFVGCLYI